MNKFLASVECIVKRLLIRVLGLFKGFVLVLIFSVFLQASLALASAHTSIKNQTDLEAIGDFLADYYVLTDNIVVSAPSGEESTYVIGNFSGTLDGNNFTISGLTKPLFDVISGTVINLNLTSVDGVTGNGALANQALASSTIDNVSFVGDSVCFLKFVSE